MHREDVGAGLRGEPGSPLQRTAGTIGPVNSDENAPQVGLVVLAAGIFLAMIVAAVSVVIWSVAGFLSATRQTPAVRH